MMTLMKPSTFLMATMTLGGTFVASEAQADQCAYINESQATAALRFVKPGMVVRAYCEPCGEHVPAASRATTVTTAVVRPAGMQGEYAEVAINGEGIDLAYTFVPYEGDYVNLASLAECPAQGVSKKLDLPASTAPANPTPAPKTP